MTRFASYYRNIFRKQRVDSDLDDEVRAFVDLKTDENVRAGMSPHQARRAALVDVGGVEQVKESVREVRAGALLEQCWQDVRFGARMLRKNLGFTLVAVLTIALGIGANASIFAVFSSLALRPMQLPDSSRVVSVYQTITGASRNIQGGASLLSYPEYLEYRDRNQVFSGLVAYMPQVGVTVGDGTSATIGELVTCNYFDVLGSKPEMGRGFSESECAAPGRGPVVVLSHDFWVNNLHSDSDAVGHQLKLNRTSLTIIGVAPADFHGTDIIPASFWTPISNASSLLRSGPFADRLHVEDLSWLAVLGRLKDGTTVPQARADLAVIAAGIDRKTAGRKTQLSVETATFFGRPDMHVVILGVGAVVLTSVGLVLLIACANLANLMLARSATRTREIAVRLAMGASRGRVVRQLLTESLLISLIGGTIGCAVSTWSEAALVKTALLRIPTGGQPVSLNVSPDIRVFVYAFALTILTGIVFGLAPALQSTRPDVNRALKQESNMEPAERRAWMRSALVGVQVAVCMVLLVAAGLLLRGLYHAQTIDPGYSMDHIAVVTYDLRREGYTPAQAAGFNRDLASRLESLPGVETAVPAFASPLAERHYISHFKKPGEALGHQVEYNVVGADFFALVGIPLVRGRDFSNTEVSSGAGVVIVNETLARQLWPGEDPLGKRLTTRMERDYELEVIGVAKDVQIAEPGKAHTPYLYMAASPEQQLEVGTMVVRTSQAARDALPALRSAAHTVDPVLKIDIAPLESNLDSWTLPSRIFVPLAGTLGALGMLLAAIGIYGTVSYSVARRVREIGIRMALGARARDVLAVLVRQAMRPVVIGSAVGLALCAAISRVLTLLLFGVSPFDPLAYASVVVFLMIVALLASYLPARRALKVDPMLAIRHE